MRSENEINPSDRYLLCNFLVPDKMLAGIKLDIAKFMANREKDDYYFKFIDWHKKTNELFVSTMYAYADMQLPKKFDIIFQIDNPNNFVNTEFTISQVVLNGWAVINEISHGHKHFAILQFKNTIPTILNLLASFSVKIQNNQQVNLGFCDTKDFVSIKNKLLHDLQNENI